MFTRIWQSSAIILLLASMIVTPACTFSVDTVLSDIDLVLQTGNVVCSAIGVVLPADSAACQAISGVGITGIQAIQTAYDAYKASGAVTDLQKLQAALAAIKTNLPAELAAAHIVDPAAVAVVTAWVGLVVGTVNDIITLIPELQTPASASATTPSRLAARVALLGSAFPTPESLKAKWETDVCRGNATCGNLVKVRHIRSGKIGRVLAFQK
jgi:hypothetical protein